jgi:hypothetical protein
MKHWLLIVTTALALAGCSTIQQIAEGIDDACVVGKLKTADAVYLNSQHPKWTTLQAKVGDRVVNGDCSDALKGAEGRDPTQATP